MSALIKTFLALPPSNISAIATSTTQVSVTWALNALATSYVIYRGGSFLASVTTGSYSDTGLTPNTTYNYTISSVGIGGEGPQSSQVSVTTPQLSTSIATVTLSGGANNLAWTVGHVFANAQVPNGSFIDAAGPTQFQADIRNRWPDGSAKYAVLSGIGGTSAQLVVVTGTAPSGEVAAGTGLASVTFTGGVTGTYACPSGNTVGAWSKSTAHLVRKISLPVMTERHYYVPTTDAHVAVWFYVRSYANDSHEVETVVENGWLNVSAPGHKTYSATVTVGGTDYAKGSITHRHHTRWSHTAWVGTDPNVTPLANMAYWRATKLVPNYGWYSPTNAVLDALYQSTNPAPMTQMGNYPVSYSGGGNKPTVSLLPHWAALAFSSGDARAIRSTIANARVSQRYAVFYRDETTGRAPHMATSTQNAPSGYRNIGLHPNNQSSSRSGWSAVGNSLAFIPEATGTFDTTAGEICDTAHACQDTFGAYLLSGRWSFMDHAQIKQMTYALVTGSTSRNYNDCLHNGEVRGRAWHFRDLGMTLSITPDDDSAMRNEFATSFATNVAWFRSNYATPTSPDYYEAGWAGNYGSNSPYGDYGATKNGAYWWDSPWMQHYTVSAFFFARDLQLPVTAQATADLTTCSDHFAKIAYGMAQDGMAGTYSYRRSAQYALVKGADGVGQPCDTKFTWQQIWATMQSELGMPALPGGNTLLNNVLTELHVNDFTTWPDDDFTAQSGAHFGDLVSALGLAANYSTEALNGYNRLAASSTWQTVAPQAYNNYPACGIAPR